MAKKQDLSQLNKNSNEDDDNCQEFMYPGSKAHCADVSGSIPFLDYFVKKLNYIHGWNGFYREMASDLRVACRISGSNLSYINVYLGIIWGTCCFDFWNYKIVWNIIITLVFSCVPAFISTN